MTNEPDHLDEAIDEHPLLPGMELAARSSFRTPRFLGRRHEPSNRVRCAIHGFIHYSDPEREVINHPLVQRLRYIRQLALTELVYPGATHSRLEHSLGVMHVASVCFDSLATKHGDLMEDTFRGVATIAESPLAMTRQALRLAGLLHDVGHAPFSHAAEKVIHRTRGDESLTRHLLEGNDGAALGGLLNRLFWPGCNQLVIALLAGPPDLPPQLQIARQLIDGPMDADKMDYLLRDSYCCGVDYGRYDLKRLVESLEALRIPGGLEIALHRDGIHALEALIVGRYQMSTQVYYHRVRRIYDRYLFEYHQALGPEAFDTPGKITSQNDFTMLTQIFSDAEQDFGERSSWARRIAKREHHWEVFGTGVNADGYDKDRFNLVVEELERRYGKILLIDVPDPIAIHKLLVPGDTGTQRADRLQLVSKDGMRRPLTEESQILRTIPATFRALRIFADVPREQRTLRREMKELARRTWQREGGH